MISPMRIWTIASNTVREAIRSKILYTLLMFAVVMIGTSAIVSSLSYVEPERIMQDVALAAIRLFSVGIAIFLGVGLIHGEIERRTIYTILSKPVSRSEFLLGKYLASGHFATPRTSPTPRPAPNRPRWAPGRGYGRRCRQGPLSCRRGACSGTR